jgi:hypothetical protein
MIPWWVCLIVGISGLMLGAMIGLLVTGALAGMRMAEMEAQYSRAIRLRNGSQS